jgi:hypothetical protein
VRSGGGAFLDGPAAEVRVLEGRGPVGHVELADIAAGRDDLVDLVEDLVGERDVGAGEEVIELLHGARPDKRAGHAKDAIASGEIRADISAKDLLDAVANLCLPSAGEGAAYSQRMVALLIDGLRYGAGTSQSRS